MIDRHEEEFRKVLEALGPEELQLLIAKLATEPALLPDLGYRESTPFDLEAGPSRDWHVHLYECSICQTGDRSACQKGQALLERFKATCPATPVAPETTPPA